MAEAITKGITEHGALIEVQVSDPADEEKSEWTIGLLDTGTNVSQISKKLFDQLGLQQTGVGTFEAAGTQGQATASLTGVKIAIEDGLEFTSELVVGVQPAIDGQEFQIMLGRDCLKELRFVYDGPDGRFTLSR